MKHSLLIRVASVLLCGGSLLGHHAAHAQEDGPYFQQYWKNHLRLKQSESKRAPQLAAPVTARKARRNGPCDLLVNGDFELQTQAPNRINNIGGGFPNTPPPNDPITTSHVQTWTSPTAGTPDYYANNATDPMAAPATAVYGGFTPLGNASVGLFTQMAYFDFLAGRNRDRATEYVETDLTAPLESARYYAQFQVNLTRNAGANVANQGLNNGFGLQVSNGRLPGGGNTTRNFLTPSGRGVLSTAPINDNNVDTWTRVSGQFDAQAGDNTLTLGNFNPAPANMTPLAGRNPNAPNTYIFVDNVELFKIPTAGPNRPCAPANTLLELGEGCAIPGATYAWHDGSGVVFATTLIASIAVPVATTTYYLTVTLPDGSTHTTSTQVSICSPLNGYVYAPWHSINDCGPVVLSVNTLGTGSGNFSYAWTASPAYSGTLGNTSTISVSPTVGTSFTVTITDNVTGQTKVSSWYVDLRRPIGPPSVWVPNIFTPNGDGRNDRWYVLDGSRGAGPLNAFGYHLRVFDRWGTQKYDYSYTDTRPDWSSQGIRGWDIHWDGRNSDGQGCVDGAYYYALEFFNCSGTHLINGWVEIMGSRYRLAPDEELPPAASAALAVYPNPANEKLLVNPNLISQLDVAASTAAKPQASARYQVTLLDKTGRVQYTGSATNQTVEIDTKSLPAGTYFLRLVGDKGKVITKQIVVDHSR